MLKKIQWQHPLYYVPLVFLVFPVSGVFYFGYPVWTLWLTFAFAVVYLYLVHSPVGRATNVCWTLILAYIVYMTTQVSGNMMWFLFYLNSLFVYRFKDSYRSYRFISYVVATLYLNLTGLLYGDDIATKIMVCLIPLINFGMLFYWKKEREGRELEEQITEQHRTINLLLAENERNRIGQDLHDTLGHVFAMLSVKGELASALLDKGELEKAKKEVQELSQIAKDAMQEVRQIVHRLKAPTLTEELAVLTNMLEIAGVELLSEQTQATFSLTPAIEKTLCMCLRELVTNLIKHSQATTCHLSLMEEDGKLVVLYEDDGVGFETVTGTELHSIRERLQHWQGTLTIVSAKQPTRITLTVPLEKEVSTL